MKYGSAQSQSQSHYRSIVEKCFIEKFHQRAQTQPYYLSNITPQPTLTLLLKGFDRVFILFDIMIEEKDLFQFLRSLLKNFLALRIHLVC
jgi:hypothetical protein